MTNLDELSTNARNDNGWTWAGLACRKRLMQRNPDVVRRMGVPRLPWSKR